MNLTENNRQQFTQIFNQLLGNKVGRSIDYQSDAQRASGITPEISAQIAAMLAKKVKVPKITKTGIANAPTSAAGLLGLVTNSQEGTDAPVIKQALALPPVIKPDNPVGSKSAGFGLHNITNFINEAPNAVGHIADYVGIAPKENAEGSLSNVAHDVAGVSNRTIMHPITKSFDVIGRPLYAVNEGGKRQAESINNKGFSWSLPNDFVQGAWQGFQGRKKTGFGQVLEATPAKNLPWGAKVVLGGVGDVTLDPLTYFSGGAITAARDATGSAIRKGIALTGRDAIIQGSGKALEETIAEMADNTLKDITRRIPHSTLNTREATTKALSRDLQVSIEDTIHEITGGGTRGKTIGGDITDHGTIANKAAQIVLDEHFKLVEKPRADYLVKLEGGHTFTDAEQIVIIKKTPQMKVWIDEATRVEKEAAQHGNILNLEQLKTTADGAYLATLDPIANEVRVKMLSKLDESVMRIPRIRYMGHDFYLNRLGKVLDKTKDLKTPRVQNLIKVFNHTSWLPGDFTRLSQKVHSMNAASLEEFGKGVEQAFVGTTHADRVEILRATQEGRQLTGHLTDPQAFFIAQNKEIFYNEAGVGVRSVASTPYASDYAFLHVKNPGKLKSFKEDWIEPRKLSVKRNSSVAQFSSKQAREAGLKVEEDAATSLMLRKAKSNNMLAKTAFEQDVYTGWSMKSRATPKNATERNLVRVNLDKHPWLSNELKPGESIWIDKDIKKVLDNYSELASYKANVASNDVVKAIDKVTTIFKTANTIYWPGFHVRNIVSDIFFGAFDGVKSVDYGKVFYGMQAPEKRFLNLGKDSVPFSRIKESYYSTSASGFYETEINVPHTANDIAIRKSELGTSRYMDMARYPGKITPALRHASTVREDFGRLVQYYHAMDDEYANFIKKGLSKEKAFKEAEISANFRVNKYKFDYNALSPFEKSIRRYGMPFYTYMRKSTPVLLEQLFMNPKYFSYIQHLQNALSPSGDFKATKLPSYLANQDFMQNPFDPSGEPTGMTNALFPTNTLQELSLSKLVKGMNPLVQGATEMGVTHKDMFSGRPVGGFPGGITDILKNKFKGTSQWKNVSNVNKSNTEILTGLLGVPFVKVTKQKQATRTHELEAQVSNKVKAYNTKLESRGVRVSVRGGKVYIVQPKSPSAKEIQDGTKPKYPLRDQEKVIAVYNTLAEIPIKL